MVSVPVPLRGGRALRETLLMAFTSNASILANIVRMKILAVAFGAGGIGLFGVFQSIVGVGTILGSVGIEGIAVRELAAARGRGDAAAVDRIRNGVRTAALILGAAAGVATVALSPWIARFVEVERPALVALLGVAVAASVGAMMMRALLNGFQHIRDLARATLLASAIGVVVAVPIALLPQTPGVVAAAVSTPVIILAVYAVFAARLPSRGPLRIAEGVRASVELARMGTLFTLAGFLPFFVQLGSRTVVLKAMGEESAGYYQATSTISAVYVGMLLSSLSTSLLPRLSGLLDDRERFRSEVTSQVRIYNALLGPALLTVMLAAPFVLSLLYAPEFAAATDMLRWQVLGDLLRVPTATLITALSAARLGRSYLATEIAWTALYLALLAWAASTGSYAWVGASFTIAAAVHFVFVSALAWRALGFRWAASSFADAAVFGAAGLVLVAWPGEASSRMAAVAIAYVASMGWAALRFRRL